MFAHGDRPIHVDFDGQVEMGCRKQTLTQSACDHLAHLAHANFFKVTTAGIESERYASRLCFCSRSRTWAWLRCNCGRRRNYCGSTFTFEEGFNILLDNATLITRTHHLFEAYARFFGDIFGQWRSLDAAVFTHSGGSRYFSYGRSRGRALSIGRRCGSAAAVGCGKYRLPIFARLTNDGNHPINGYGAFFYSDMQDDAFYKSIQFHRGFVRLHLCQGLPRFHTVAFFFQPTNDVALFHRVTHAGHPDDFSHMFCFLSFL